MRGREWLPAPPSIHLHTHTTPAQVRHILFNVFSTSCLACTSVGMLHVRVCYASVPSYTIYITIHYNPASEDESGVTQPRAYMIGLN